MKLSELTENDVIHIRTKKEANRLAELLNRLGMVNFNGEPYTVDWLYDKERFYLKVKNGALYQPEFLKREFNIIPASRFLKSTPTKKELQAALSIVGDELSGVRSRLTAIEHHIAEPKYVKTDCPENVKEGLPELEVNKWYKCPEVGKAIFFVTELSHYDVKAYGFNFRGEWIDESWDWGTPKIGKRIPASDTEVFEALKAEAERRGFKEGVKINSFITKGYTLTNSAPFKMTIEKYTGVEDKYSLRFGGSCIYTNGQWATIIPQPEAIDWSKAGQLVEYNDVVVYTDGNQEGLTFSGTRLGENAIYKDTWMKEYFTLKN